jgi:hypothetical protein
LQTINGKFLMKAKGEKGFLKKIVLGNALIKFCGKLV